MITDLTARPPSALLTAAENRLPHISTITKYGLGIAVCVSSFLFSSSLLAQGPLAPPGPPAPTMKTLDQLDSKLDQAVSKGEARTPITSLPFTISVPGSYYLPKNLTIASGSPDTAININVSNVTVDLNGFSLIGTGGTGTPSGIRINGASGSPLRGIAVKNGSIEGFYYALYGFNAENCSWSDVRCSAPRSTGIILQDSSGNLVKKVTVIGSVFTAFSFTGSANNNHVEDCSATSSTANGFNLSPNTSGVGNVIERCLAQGNTQTGFVISGANVSGNVIRECSATGNGADGISLAGGTTGNRIDSNQASKNVGSGIRSLATSKNIIVRNSLLGNTGAPSFAAGDLVGATISAAGTFTSDQPWANFIVP